MSNEIDRILYSVAEEVLEKLAFIFSFPADEQDEIDIDDTVSAKVSFNGPYTGSLIMMVSKPALPDLAENMLGMDENEETTVDQQYDALKELINVICGNLLPAVAGKQEIFSVDMPFVVPENQNAAIRNEHDPESVAKLSLEVGQCHLYLYVDGGLPGQPVKREP